MLFGWFRPINHGIVIAKRHYSPTATQMEHVVGTKGSAFIAPAIPGSSESWSLIVQDLNNPRTKEIYVWAEQWAYTQVGDEYKGIEEEWPPTSKA